VNDILQSVLSNSQTPTGGVFVISVIILLLGLNMLGKLRNDSPFAANAMQILTIILLIPASMFLGVTQTINAEAVTGILGGIAGYVFAKAGESRAATAP
jgi:hypothetical protein